MSSSRGSPFHHCVEHGAMASERWVVCIHTNGIQSARLVDDQPLVTGEALCPSCQRAVDSGERASEFLRIACGLCVRRRWPIEGSA